MRRSDGVESPNRTIAWRLTSRLYRQVAENRGDTWSLDTVLPDPAARLLTARGTVLLRVLDRAADGMRFAELVEYASGGNASVRRGLRRLSRLGLIHAGGSPRRFQVNRLHVLYPSVAAMLSARSDLIARLANTAAEYTSPTTTVALVTRSGRGGAGPLIAIVHRNDVDRAALRRAQHELTRAAAALIGPDVSTRLVKLDELLRAPQRTRERYWRSHTLHGPDLAATLLNARVQLRSPSRGHN